MAASALDGPAAAGPVSMTGNFQDGTYIVVLDKLPLATNPGTAGSAMAKVDTTSAKAISYTDQLLAQQDGVLQGVSAEPTYRYTVALNGFAVKLTAAEAAALSQRSDVVSVTRSTMRQLDSDILGAPDGAPANPDTDLSPDLLGLRGEGGVWSQLGGPMEAGKGTVVGVIDSGIAYDNDSFAADGMPAAPAGWAGECETGEGDDAGDFPASACTNKIVGARYFVEGARAAGYNPITAESVSPLDTDGHGSHVAGTAVGREVSLEDAGGETYDLAGMVPGAHVAAYKVCYDFEDVSGCFPDDSIAAIDAAVADGVDVINFSISGDPTTYEDPVDLAFKNATAAGVFNTASAGNSAEDGVAVAHIGPWQTTVGASTHRAEDGPVPSIGSFSGRGPVDVAPDEQTILKPDLGAPGINVLAAVASEGGTPGWNYLTGTSMSSPHVAGLGALIAAEYPEWSPMAVKSALQTSTIDYANAESNQAVVGGTGFVEPRAFLEPGLVFDSGEADWDAFLADPSTGYDLNAAYVSIPALGAEPTVLTRTVTNPGDADATFEASFAGPDTLSVTVEPSTVTVPAGGTAEVTISVANTGAATDAWQEGDLSWTSGDTVVEIPVLARGQVAGEDPGPEPDPMVERVFGKDRYATASEISELYPAIDTVYIASGTGFADAMSGSPAATQGLIPRMATTPDGDPAPVLLTKNDHLPNATIAALDTLDPSNIVILGGDGAVSEDVEGDLAAWGDVTRVEGTDRYETSANLAMMFGEDVDTVYLASGDDVAYADALAGAARAGSETAPVLLTRPDMVPAATAEALATLNPDTIVVLGGEGAVSDVVYTQVQADERISGANRYETAVAISQEHDADIPVVYIASGRDFPDALAGSALAGHEDVPVLLTKPNQLPSATLAELDRLSPERVVILGGTNAVSQQVEDRLNEEYPGWVG
ncbi:cell wall-binding repeat-containing protein [Serinicoccus profundi]|uniref:cell wall-binding repeat-containing protein n=1 Tax=Serinicoccus profundi TaxID=1078471 RepID=UPI000255EB65|nr:cell wall-binding repeat-containing protein [Serinicoccus profundi]